MAHHSLPPLLAGSLELSTRGSGAMHRLAQNLAGNAYAKAHDTGGSIHPSGAHARCPRQHCSPGRRCSMPAATVGKQQPQQKKPCTPLRQPCLRLTFFPNAAAAEDISVRHGSANRRARGNTANEGSSRGRFSLRPWRSASQAALQGGSVHR